MNTLQQIQQPKHTGELITMLTAVAGSADLDRPRTFDEYNRMKNTKTEFKKESVAEYIKRGGKITKLAISSDMPVLAVNPMNKKQKESRH
jgi:hypothetical protein